jgi:hypothetical protein
MNKSQWPNSWAPKPNISLTSMKAFDECQRRWLYYSLPNEIKGEVSFGIRAEKSLMPWEAFAGQVVDDVLREAFNNYMIDERWPVDLLDRAKAIWKNYSAWSVELKKRAANRKLSNFGEPNAIDRIFFGDPLGDEQKDRLRNVVRTSLENFETSGIKDFIANYPTETWRITKPIADQPIPWYRFGDVPVYASYDFAIEDGEQAILFDWKTGKKSQWSMERVKEQLHGYAGFAMTQWSVPPERISLIAFFMGEGTEWDAFPVDMQYLSNMQERWKSRYADLVHRVRQCGDQLHKWEAMFPLTDRVEQACARCQFRSCEGYGRVAAIEKDVVREVGVEEWFYE